MAESLVHECGHQMLYAVMELEPLIRQRTDVGFTLPWSGAERDGYGYFHAVYIYLLLALFFERTTRCQPRQSRRAAERLEAILAGLELALPQLQDAEIFTPAGRAFFDRMVDISVELIARAHPVRRRAKKGASFG